jgi:hypothetical protein
MTKLIVLLWSGVRRLLRNLSMLLLFGVVIIGVAGWLAPPPGQRLRPGVEHELDDRPGDGIVVSAQVMHIWLPEPLVSLAKPVRWSLPEQRHEQLRQILEGQDRRDLCYALSVQVRQVNGRVENILFIRHPFDQPENLQELLDVLATAAGEPPKYPTTDYSAAIIHVVPAETSPQQLLHQIEASSVSRDSGLPAR